MNIAIRMEGGLGDILCANRFVPAIQEKHPGAKIEAYLDTEGNPMQEDALRSFYPKFYDNIITIPSKKYKPFITKHQFGTDDCFGAIENIPDEYRDDMTLGYDRFYDLHIDGMKWPTYDFDWLRYFYFFPRPTIYEKLTDSGILKDFQPFAFLHLASNNTKSAHVNEKWYVKNLVKKISKDIRCVVPVTKATEEYLDCLRDMDNVNLIWGSIPQIAYIISKSSIFLGIDSGLKYLAAGLSIPSLIYVAQSPAPHQVLPSHLVRWLHRSTDYIPVNYDLNYVATLTQRIIANPVLSLTPLVTNAKSGLVIRDYVVDETNSKLQ